MTERFVSLPGSERSSEHRGRVSGPLADSTPIEATLVLRRRAELPYVLVEGPGTVSRAELAERYGADPADVELVRTVLSRHGIRVPHVHHGSRRVGVAGTAGELGAVFGTRLSMALSPDPTSGAPVEHRAREGALQLPAELDGVVVAVLGLDTRPQARAHLRVAPRPSAAAAQPTSYTPLQLGEVYRFPAGTDGSGQTLAIIELGGGFSATDLDTYFGSLGVTPPSTTAVSVDGGANVAGKDPQGADGEVLLDIEVAGSLAPGAAQVVYFSPNTDQGFIDAVSTAVHAEPTPTALSISWGGPENTWTAQAMTAFDAALADAAALGVTVCVAAGDNGSSDGASGSKPHTDFPASSPHALACGGTSLQADAGTGTVQSETVWNDGTQGGATGGGVSAQFPLPSWQATAGVPKHGHKTGRGVPDVAADADPETGYQVYVDGQAMVIGGTSAVAPLWAALTCRLAQSLGRPLGLLQPLLYASVTPGHTAPGFRDITSGSNGAYSAGPGWDACTGLGSPEGTALLAALQAAGSQYRIPAPATRTEVKP
jgi:kumamolisin